MALSTDGSTWRALSLGDPPTDPRTVIWLTRLVCEMSSIMSSMHHLCHTGSDVYVDISGWHLYLRDLNAVPGVKMADALANKLGAVRWLLQVVVLCQHA